jgi:hypothetical protein
MKDKHINKLLFFEAKQINKLNLYKLLQKKISNFNPFNVGLCIIDFVLSTTKLKCIHFEIEYIISYHHIIYTLD